MQRMQKAFAKMMHTPDKCAYDSFACSVQAEPFNPVPSNPQQLLSKCLFAHGTAPKRQPVTGGYAQLSCMRHTVVPLTLSPCGTHTHTTTHTTSYIHTHKEKLLCQTWAGYRRVSSAPCRVHASHDAPRTRGW